VAAIARRANRWLSGTKVELDLQQCAETHNKIHQALEELGPLEAKIPDQPISREQGAGMLSQSQRSAIKELNTEKVSRREIARVLKVNRQTVSEVLRSGSAEGPMLSHPCLLPQIQLVEPPHYNAEFRTGPKIRQEGERPVGWRACIDGLVNLLIQMAARSRKKGGFLTSRRTISRVSAIPHREK
jgi:chaperonin cofactor prefoldin